MTLKQACLEEAPCAFKDLMIHKFCNSHYVSHFAAFFIVVRAKISVAESYNFITKSIMWQFLAHSQVWLEVGWFGFVV
jgi:hypothetical protein